MRQGEVRVRGEGEGMIPMSIYKNKGGVTDKKAISEGARGKIFGIHLILMDCEKASISAKAGCFPHQSAIKSLWKT